MPDERDRWITLIKSLRQEHGVSIYDAERIALGEVAWQRWVDRQINTDMRCRRMALFHIRSNGSASLLEKDGDQLKVR
jgi:hypothetical protein